MSEDKQLDSFRTNVKDKLSELLSIMFADCIQKQRIKHTTNGYNFACPYCRDSATDMNKKRGNLSIRGKFAGMYKCYNCGKSTNIQTFFKDFHEDLSSNDILYIKQNIVPDFDNVRGKISNIKITSEFLNKDTVEKYALSKEYLKSALNLVEISQSTTPVAYDYLVKRGQSDFSRLLYSFKFNQIIILNMVNDKLVIGFQARNLNYDAKVKYLTYNIVKLRQWFLKDNSEIPDRIVALSTMFNVFNIDINKPILVTEGPFDAFLLPNAIATSGAGKNINMSLPFWFVYDYDKTGVEHAVEKLNEGYKVFMWKKLSKELNLEKRNKWDITDLVLYVRKNNIKFNLMEYFTDNALDVLSL